MAARPSRPTVPTMNAPQTPNWPGRIALAAAVALIVGYALLAPRTPTRTCAAGTVSLAVAASQEKSALLRELAQAYERGDARVGERCVSVQILEKASGDAEQALARGWEETSDGPRPDVWSPASTAWTVLLREHRSARDAAGGLVPQASPSLLQSPLVLAMPVPMAEALGWPNAEIGWSDVLALARDPRGWAARGHPEWGRFRLGKTDPRISTSGLHALVGAFFAATGRSADLTEADVADARVVAFVKGVESSVVHYGETVSTFVRNLRAADQRGTALTYVSAIAIEEKQVWDYNQGQNGARPAIPLAAVSPKEGTLVADHPYVVLNAPWVDAPKRDAAAGFLAYLQGTEAQARFRAAGFRDKDGRGGPELALANGIVPAGPAIVISPPAPTVLAAIQRSWDDVRKRARVLMVLDVSGSMAGTKIDLMKRAAAGAIDGFAADDELAIWAFSGGRQEVAPLGAVGPRRDELKRGIGTLVADGSTALYASARAGVTFLRSRADDSRINAVLLLTDGKNEDADRDLDGLLASLRTEDETARVRVFTIGYGDDADRTTLQKIAEASRAAFYDASKPATIDRVFRDVVSNF